MAGTANAPRTAAVSDGEVEAVLTACRLLVGVSAQSIAVIEDQVDLMQFRGLVVLASNDAMSLGQFASAAHIHLTRASRMCDRMVRLGLIDRAEDPTNRRQVLLTLTPAGRVLVDTVMSARRAAISPLLAKMSRARRGELVSLLREFAMAGGDPADADLWAMGWPN